MGWHRHGQRPIRQRAGRLVPQGRDRVECLAVRAAHLVQGFPEMLQQRQAVRALCGCRSPGPSALGRGGRAIARADLAPWLFPEPQSEGLGRASREERDRVAALQIDQHGAVCLAYPQRAVIHPQDRRQRERRGQRPPEQAQQRVPLPPPPPPLGHPSPGPGSRHGRQPFGADAATAAGIAAQPCADPQLEVHTGLRPQQISQRALIVTVDMMRRGGAQRTRCRSLGRAHAQGELCRGVINRPRLKAQERGLRYQAGKDRRGWCRDESGLLLPSRMSLEQREVCIPTASGESRMSGERYKVEQRRMPRYSRV